jgi:hypothetical protein
MCNLLFYHTPPRLIIITGLFVATYLTSWRSTNRKSWYSCSFF